MKKWALLIGGVLVIGLFIRVKPAGVDVAALKPVEVLYVDSKNGSYYLFTDTGQQGSGKTVQLAIKDLKARSSGKVFLNTAEHLLISPVAWEAVGRFSQYLRPDCGVVIAVGQPDMKNVPDFLQTHKPDVTLNDLRAGERGIPVLYSGEGGMCLEQP